MLPPLGRTSTVLTTRIGLSAMRLVMFAYLIFAVLGVAGSSSALAGHSWLEMSHFRDDASQTALCEACSSIGIAPKPAEAGFIPPKISSIAHSFEVGGAPAAIAPNLALAADLFTYVLAADACCQQDNQAPSIADVSALAALRQHVHRSVVLHL
ncbi:MAG TPA: hypothetical protein VHO91_06895 [Rhodopila sp.]|nr:hypothetical protein [Rhodopila sp.]